MRQDVLTSLHPPGTELEAVIREARRRQRRRQLVIGLAVAAVLAGAAGVVAGIGLPAAPRRVSHPRPKPSASGVSRQALPGPIPRSVDTTVLMWPVGYPAFGPDFGPPAYLDDLATGQLSRRHKPTFAGGDFQPYLVRVGRWLVYVGDGTMAIRDDLMGKPRVLGSTPFFAPAASPGHVWLERFSGADPGMGRGRASVWQVSVRTGRRGPVITLPRRSFLLAGTDAGLLLKVPQGQDFGLALWRPGSALRTLPYSPLAGYGFDLSPRLVGYGTGCQDRDTRANTYYATCPVLRVFDVVTGALVSFRAPPGTAGWIPSGFDLTQSIAPRDPVIAAYAATRPPGQGQARLFVIRLTGAAARPVAVPLSTAHIYARTAWSANRSWLFYQGPRGRMWAYQISSGKIRASSTPCCSYTVMAAFPSGRR
jgi:hypothetical protein